MKKFFASFLSLLATAGLFLTQSSAAFAQGGTGNIFDQFNPLVISGSPYADTFSKPGGIISRVLLFALPIAGTILFLMFVWGGFEMISSASTAKSKDAGRQRVTAAVTGFVLLFASYWIVQIIQVIFGVHILN